MILIHDSAIFQLTQRCKQRLFVLPGDFASNKRLIGILLGNGLLSLKVQKQNKQKYMQTQCKYWRENDLQRKRSRSSLLSTRGRKKKSKNTRSPLHSSHPSFRRLSIRKGKGAQAVPLRPIQGRARGEIPFALDRGEVGG